MVNYSDRRYDALFLALADSTRRAMVRRLSRGPATIGELGRPFAMTKPAVTKHVKKLEEAGLIRRERRGRTHTCVLDPAAMLRAEEWIERHRKFWESCLDRLVRVVEATTEEVPVHPAKGAKE
jgi:DNA-binding transcriptional ArsR family regulator